MHLARRTMLLCTLHQQRMRMVDFSGLLVSKTKVGDMEDRGRLFGWTPGMGVHVLKTKVSQLIVQ